MLWLLSLIALNVHVISAANRGIMELTAANTQTIKTEILKSNNMLRYRRVYSRVNVSIAIF